MNKTVESSNNLKPIHIRISEETDKRIKKTLRKHRNYYGEAYTQSRLMREALEAGIHTLEKKIDTIKGRSAKS